MLCKIYYDVLEFHINNYLVFENPDHPNIITSKCIKVDFKERKKNESILAYDANESGQFTH